MRTANSRTFEQADGSFVSQFYAEPIFWQPPGHTDWQPIDTKLRPTNDNGVAARTEHAPAQLDLAAVDNASGFAVLHGGGHVIRFRLPEGTAPGRAGAQPVIRDNGLFADYADLLPGGIGLRVFPKADGFTSFIVLPTRPATNVFAFEIEAPGLELVALDDGSIAFVDQHGARVGRIPRPYMVDSSELEGRGGGLYSEAVTTTLTVLRGPAYLLTLTVDEAFLDSAVYPVYVDPSPTEFPTGTTTVDDTFASQRWPNTARNNFQRPSPCTPFPCYHEMWHGLEPGTNYYNEVFIRFNGIASTLGAVVVESATLDFYPYWQYYHSGGRNSYWQRITGTWSPSSLTWNQRPAVDGTQTLFTTTEGQWSGTDVTAYVQGTVNGDWTDQGLKIHNSSGGQGAWKRIIASEADGSGAPYKPHLTVAWHVPDGGRRGEESYYTRVPFDLGGDWRMAVGVHNGELSLDRNLFGIPSYGPPQSMSLSYSSLNTESGYLGTGWSSNLTQHVSFDGSDVYWHRADNGLVPFLWGGTSWTPTAGHFETLSLAGGEYTITSKDQTRLVFESTGLGRLKRIVNRFGKTLTLVWNTNSATATDASGRATSIVIGGGLITSVTDSAGRAWLLGYTSGQLTSVTDPAGNVTTLVYTTGLLTGVNRSHYVGGQFWLLVNWTIAYTDGKATGVTDASHLLSPVPSTFDYDGATTTVGLLKTHSPIVRNTWTYTLDSSGRVTAALDPQGFTTSYVYDANSNLTSLTLPITKAPDPVANQLITYTYDSRGNVLSQTTQLTATTNVVTAMSYNATNDLLTRSEANNDASQKLVTRYTYDGSGHLTSVNVNCTSSGTTPPADASSCTGAGTQNASTNLVTTYTYTANDQLETETDALGHVTKSVYDSSGNQTQTITNYVSGQSSTNERNVTTSFAYDQQTAAGKAGLATSMTDPLGNLTGYTYDALGRQLSETQPGDASIPALTRTMTYDEFGNVLTDTDAWTGVTRTTTYAYDYVNRQTRVTDPTGVQINTAYNEAGDMISTTSGGVTTTKTVDGLGQTTELTVESSTTTADYDGRGLGVATDDPTGVSVTAIYDLGGRLLSETVHASTGDLVTSHVYDLLGRETSSTTPDGVTTTTVYDRAGRVTSSTVAGATTGYVYDRAGNQVSVTDPGGTLTTTTYDPLNRPTVVIANDVANPTLPIEDVTSTTYYDAAGRTVAVRDDAGITTRSIYNPRGVVSQTIANCTDSGTTPTANPAACVGAGTHNASANIVSTTAFDGSGAAILVVSAQGSGSPEATFEYAYDAAGRTLAVKDALGTVTGTLYDSTGRVTSTIANCTESTSYPAAPPTGNWWTCDGSTLVDGTWNVTSSRTYDSHGNVASETAPNGRVTTYVYDAAERLVQRIDNDVPTITLPDQDISTYYAYDDAGRQSAVRAPTADRITFAVTRYIYNAAGQLYQEIRNCTDSGTTPPSDPAWKTCAGNGTRDADTNLVTEYGYDSRGNRVSVTAPDPSAATGTSTATVITRYAFDNQNRLCGVLEHATVGLPSPDPCVSPGGGTDDTNVWTRYLYDDLGNMTSMVDARGNTTAYGYDALSHQLTVTDADGGTTTYAYNSLGQRISQSRRGQPAQTLVSWTYDAAGRMATRTAGGVTTSYTYDDSGNRISASSTGSTITTTYDRLNRPLTVTVSGDSPATTTYTYSLTAPTWTDPSGAYAASLDKFDRQVALTDPIHGAAQFSWTYRADGQSATIAAPNGNTTTFGYDDAGALMTKSTAAGGTSRAAYTWARNRAGQILSEASTITNDPSNGTTTYTYDPLGRLLSCTRSGSTSAYGWQAVPNRDLVTVNGDSTSYTFDAANREDYGSLGDYDYNDEGQLTNRPGQILTWDDLGRLTQVKNASTQAVIAAYTYDALDRLLVVTPQTGSAYRFRYVGLTTQVAQVVTDSTGISLYTVANGWDGERLFEWTVSSQTFYGTNAHHDLTWTASSTGAVSATLRYDPWGNLSASFGSYLPSFRFQGSWFDPTVELSWVVTRWYAPSLGRFVSEDSLLGPPIEPASRNLYAYGQGDPISNFDPSGQSWQSVYSSTLEDYARQFLGSASLWPMIWNANRDQFSSTPTRLSRPYMFLRGCIYIPTEWLSHPYNGGPDRCSGPRSSFRNPTLQELQDVLDAQRVKKIGSPLGMFSFTREQLYSATDITTNRSRRPSASWWSLVSLNVGTFNDRAQRYIINNGWPEPQERLNDVWFSEKNCPLPFVPSTNACAIGQYIFMAGAQTWSTVSSQALQSHEYIHVLQYEGRGQYYEDSYIRYARADWLYRGWLPWLGADYSRAKNPEESIPYLWGNWISFFSRYEPRPWHVWFRP